MQLLGLFLVGIVAVVDAIQIQNHDVKRIPTLALPDIFGPVTTKMFESAQARRRKAAKGAHMLPGIGDRSANTCDMCINFVLHSDTTLGWTQEFRGQIAGQFQHILQDVKDNHSGTTFSVVSFQDKPVPELGEITDYCISYDAQMMEDPLGMLQVYANTPEGVGSDWPENHFGSLYELVNSPSYLPLSKHSDCSTLIVTITDAAPHFEGDEWQVDYPHMPNYTDDYDETKGEEFCRERYYPTAFMVGEALLDLNYYHGTIVWRAEDLNTLALRSWAWFDSLLGQEDGFTQALFDDDNDWMTPLETIIRAFVTDLCGPTVSTAAPTTTGRASSEAGITVTFDGATQISTARGTETTESTDPISSSQSRPGTGVMTESTSEKGVSSDTGTRRTTTTGASESSWSEVTTDAVCPGDVSTTTVETSSSSDKKTESTSTALCSCPGEDPCCFEQPELYLMIKKKPAEFDMHMKG